MRIANLSTKRGSMSSSDKFVTDNGTTVTKIDYNALAKAIIEQYTGSSLAGSAQSVKAALDSLNSKTLTGTIRSGETASFALSGNGVALVACSAANTARQYLGWYIGSASNVIEVYKGANIVVSSDANNVFTISNIGASGFSYYEVTVFNRNITVTVS